MSVTGGQAAGAAGIVRPNGLAVETWRIESLQVLRAAAAIIVVAFHLGVDTMPEVLGRTDVSRPAFLTLHAGVGVFFVLSGFLMTLVHSRDFGVPSRTGRFLWKRVSRIYLTYWVVLAVSLLLRVGFDGIGALPSAQALLKAVVLVPNWQDPVLVIAWTLSFEVLFYLMLALVILHRWIGGAIMGAWFAATAWSVATGSDGWGSAFLLSPFNLLFLFGILAAWWFRKLPVPVAAMAVLLGLAVFGAVGFDTMLLEVGWPREMQIVLFGLASLALIAGLARLDWQGLVGAPRPVVHLGDASYSIYLTHTIVLTAAARVLMFLGLDHYFSDPALATLLGVGAIVAGVLFHFAVERPLLRRARGVPQWLGRQTRSTP